MAAALFSIFVFPGLLFLCIAGWAAEYIDRKVYAKLQNRIGPPWFQPFADFIKLLAKAEVIPTAANVRMFQLAPLFAFTSVATVFIYLPVLSPRSFYSFDGDIIMVLYLLTVPTLAFFIGGWYSTSLFARLGSVRAVTQLFAYEVPLFMSILAAALLANSWSLEKIVLFYNEHPWACLINLIGFAVAVVALLGKLEKVPFDIPEAETEIVAGPFTEYSGRLFAVLRMTVDMEMIVGATLLLAVFCPMWFLFGPVLGFFVYLVEVLAVILLLALLRTVVARLRIDQMVDFCWKYLVPLAVFQLLLNLALKGILFR